MSCLDEATVLAFVAGKLSATQAGHLDGHLDGCRGCRDLVVHAARTTLAPSIAASQAETEPGSGAATAGTTRSLEPADERYQIRELLGCGGQALVYLAHDQVLGRDIALKVLRPDAAGGDRILDEARLAARLSHPHIVAIHDAGATADGAIYLAMEHVAGGSLVRWLAATPSPSPREVMRVCAEAGRGLAAAHAAGLVHRDVKPANVLVDGDGRARLGDFGLATDRGGDGQLAGTLPYMAPEQLDGHATAAADQFALAVTAWEALTGELPFAGRTPDERRVSIARGPAAPARPLPRALAAALTRALAADPARRFATVGELVTALEHDPARGRRRLVAAAAAIVVLAIGAGVAWAAWPAPPARACAGLDHQLDGVWDDTVRAGVTQAFAASPMSFAAAAAARATAALDGYAADWVRARTAGCEAAQVRREDTPALGALRTQCLDERKAALGATARALAAADRATVERSDELVRGLPSLAPCSNTTWLLERVRPPDDVAARAAVDDAVRLVAESDAALRGGQLPRARELIALAATAAARAGHAPTSAHVAFEQGLIAARAGEPAAARVSLEQAAELAQRGKDDVIAAEAWIELVNVVGYAGGEHDEALRLAGFAEATIARLGGDAGQLATLDTYRCAVLDQLGRADEARARCESARRTREATFGAGDPRVASVLILEARLAVQAGRFPDATAAAARAVAIREQALGADHPQLVEALFTVGQVARWQGQLDAAAAAFARAVTIARPAFGDDSSVMGSLAAETAALLFEQEKLPEALVQIDRAIAIGQRLTGLEHPSQVFNLTQRGRILDELGRVDDAIAALELARVIAAATLPPGHPSMNAILEDLALARKRSGRTRSDP